MIEKEEYCMNILTQSLAVQKSLRSLDKLILENHLRTHVHERFSSKNIGTKKETIKELLNLYEISNVRSNQE